MHLDIHLTIEKLRLQKGKSVSPKVMCLESGRAHIMAPDSYPDKDNPERETVAKGRGWWWGCK